MLMLNWKHVRIMLSLYSAVWNLRCTCSSTFTSPSGAFILKRTPLLSRRVAAHWRPPAARFWCLRGAAKVLLNSPASICCSSRSSSPAGRSAPTTTSTEYLASAAREEGEEAAGPPPRSAADAAAAIMAWTPRQWRHRQGQRTDPPSGWEAGRWVNWHMRWPMREERSLTERTEANQRGLYSAAFMCCRKDAELGAAALFIFLIFLIGDTDMAQHHQL